jgi:hypothetical protein
MHLERKIRESRKIITTTSRIKLVACVFGEFSPAGALICSTLIKEKLDGFGLLGLPRQTQKEMKKAPVNKSRKKLDYSRECDHFYYLIIFISRCISRESFFTKLGSVCVCVWFKN